MASLFARKPIAIAEQSYVSSTGRWVGLGGEENRLHFFERETERLGGGGDFPLHDVVAEGRREGAV